MDANAKHRSMRTTLMLLAAVGGWFWGAATVVPPPSKDSASVAARPPTKVAARTGFTGSTRASGAGASVRGPVLPPGSKIEKNEDAKKLKAGTRGAGGVRMPEYDEEGDLANRTNLAVVVLGLAFRL